MIEGIKASFLAGLCAVIGVVPMLFVKGISKRIISGLLGFASGIMVTTSTFNLLLPAIHRDSLWKVISGIVVGFFLMLAMEVFVPHLHADQAYSKGPNRNLLKAILIGAAIALHNIPEGLAIGVGYGSGAASIGLVLALSIGTHNIPEGMVLAATLLENKFPKPLVFLLSFITGIIEPISALIALISIGFIHSFISFFLAFAAGAMFYVVFNELIPECHDTGFKTTATFGFLLGIIAILVLEKIVGVKV